jgi:hypothetical protein
VYVKPESIAPNSTIYADRGGYTMRRVIKEELEKRGHTVVVGTATANEISDDDAGDIDIDTYVVPDDARYAIKIKERQGLAENENYTKFSKLAYFLKNKYNY